MYNRFVKRELSGAWKSYPARSKPKQGGAIGMTPLEVVKALLGEGTERQQTVVMDFRLSRIVHAVLPVFAVQNELRKN
ncbi:hypothetical protein [Cohnella phaseoli]|nr:hypothetical protein [Cohnella phaseoli]